jgi:hypothetical protein
MGVWVFLSVSLLVLAAQAGAHTLLSGVSEGLYSKGDFEVSLLDVAGCQAARERRSTFYFSSTKYGADANGNQHSKNMTSIRCYVEMECQSNSSLLISVRNATILPARQASSSYSEDMSRFPVFVSREAGFEDINFAQKEPQEIEELKQSILSLFQTAHHDHETSRVSGAQHHVLLTYADHIEEAQGWSIQRHGNKSFSFQQSVLMAVHTSECVTVEPYEQAKYSMNPIKVWVYASATRIGQKNTASYITHAKGEKIEDALPKELLDIKLEQRGHTFPKEAAFLELQSKPTPPAYEHFSAVAFEKQGNFISDRLDDFDSVLVTKFKKMMDDVSKLKENLEKLERRWKRYLYLKAKHKSLKKYKKMDRKITSFADNVLETVSLLKVATALTDENGAFSRLTNLKKSVSVVIGWSTREEAIKAAAALGMTKEVADAIAAKFLPFDDWLRLSLKDIEQVSLNRNYALSTLYGANADCIPGIDLRPIDKKFKALLNMHSSIDKETGQTLKKFAKSDKEIPTEPTADIEAEHLGILSQMREIVLEDTKARECSEIHKYAKKQMKGRIKKAWKSKKSSVEEINSILADLRKSIVPLAVSSTICMQSFEEVERHASLLRDSLSTNFYLWMDKLGFTYFREDKTYSLIKKKGVITAQIKTQARVDGEKTPRLDKETIKANSHMTYALQVGNADLFNAEFHTTMEHCIHDLKSGKCPTGRVYDQFKKITPFFNLLGKRMDLLGDTPVAQVTSLRDLVPTKTFDSLFSSQFFAQLMAEKISTFIMDPACKDNSGKSGCAEKAKLLGGWVAPFVGSHKSTYDAIPKKCKRKFEDKDSRIVEVVKAQQSVLKALNSSLLQEIKSCDSSNCKLAGEAIQHINNLLSGLLLKANQLKEFKTFFMDASNGNIKYVFTPLHAYNEKYITVKEGSLAHMHEHRKEIDEHMDAMREMTTDVFLESESGSIAATTGLYLNPEQFHGLLSENRAKLEKALQGLAKEKTVPKEVTHSCASILTALSDTIEASHEQIHSTNEAVLLLRSNNIFSKEAIKWEAEGHQLIPPFQKIKASVDKLTGAFAKLQAELEKDPKRGEEVSNIMCASSLTETFLSPALKTSSAYLKCTASFGLRIFSEFERIILDGDEICESLPKLQEFAATIRQRPCFKWVKEMDNSRSGAPLPERGKMNRAWDFVRQKDDYPITHYSPLVTPQKSVEAETEFKSGTTPDFEWLKSLDPDSLNKIRAIVGIFTDGVSLVSATCGARGAMSNAIGLMNSKISLTDPNGYADLRKEDVDNVKSKWKSAFKNSTAALRHYRMLLRAAGFTQESPAYAELKFTQTCLKAANGHIDSIQAKKGVMGKLKDKLTSLKEFDVGNSMQDQREIFIKCKGGKLPLTDSLAVRQLMYKMINVYGEETPPIPVFGIPLTVRISLDAQIGAVLQFGECEWNHGAYAVIAPVLHVTVIGSAEVGVSFMGIFGIGVGVKATLFQVSTPFQVDMTYHQQYVAAFRVQPFLEIASGKIYGFLEFFTKFEKTLYEWKGPRRRLKNFCTESNTTLFNSCAEREPIAYPSSQHENDANPAVRPTLDGICFPCRLSKGIWECPMFPTRYAALAGSTNLVSELSKWLSRTKLYDRDNQNINFVSVCSEKLVGSVYSATIGIRWKNPRAEASFFKVKLRHDLETENKAVWTTALIGGFLPNKANINTDQRHKIDVKATLSHGGELETGRNFWLCISKSEEKECKSRNPEHALDYRVRSEFEKLVSTYVSNELHSTMPPYGEARYPRRHLLPAFHSSYALAPDFNSMVAIQLHQSLDDSERYAAVSKWAEPLAFRTSSDSGAVNRIQVALFSTDPPLAKAELGLRENSWIFSASFDMKTELKFNLWVTLEDKSCWWVSYTLEELESWYTAIYRSVLATVLQGKYIDETSPQLFHNGILTIDRESHLLGKDDIFTTIHTTVPAKLQHSEKNPSGYHTIKCPVDTKEMCAEPLLDPAAVGMKKGIFANVKKGKNLHDVLTKVQQLIFSLANNHVVAESKVFQDMLNIPDHLVPKGGKGAKFGIPIEIGDQCSFCPSRGTIENDRCTEKPLPGLPIEVYVQPGKSDVLRSQRKQQFEFEVSIPSNQGTKTWKVTRQYQEITRLFKHNLQNADKSKFDWKKEKAKWGESLGLWKACDPGRFYDSWVGCKREFFNVLATSFDKRFAALLDKSKWDTYSTKVKHILSDFLDINEYRLLEIDSTNQRKDAPEASQSRGLKHEKGKKMSKWQQKRQREANWVKTGFLNGVPLKFARKRKGRRGKKRTPSAAEIEIVPYVDTGRSKPANKAVVTHATGMCFEGLFVREGENEKGSMLTMPRFGSRRRMFFDINKKVIPPSALLDFGVHNCLVNSKAFVDDLTRDRVL